MRLNRGCGCVLLVLGVLNFVLMISAIIGLVTGEMSIQLGILSLVVFGGNMVAALMLGSAGLRGVRIGARRQDDGVDVGGLQEASDADAGEFPEEGSD